MISLRSGVTKKVLNYFFINPQQFLYINELARMLKVDKRNLVKKIKELEREGILTSEYKGNLKICAINKNYPLYDEYRKILMKTSGLEKRLRDITAKIQGIKEAYIYGSYARDTMAAHSDIDLFVVGSHSVIGLQKELSKLQKDTGREINVVNIDEKEFKKKIKANDPFVAEMLKQKYIRVL